MGFLGNLFKSKRRRQLEREVAVQQVLTLHRQRVKELEKHEREYAQKAVRARREGDKSNYHKLVRLIAQTMNERRRLQSSLLSFEALVQTQKRVEGYAAFADGMRNATRAIAEVFRDIDLNKVVLQLDTAVTQAQSLDVAMDNVLDRISTTLFEGPEAAAGEAVSVDEIDKMLTEETEHAEASGGDEIEHLLGKVEEKLKEAK